MSNKHKVIAYIFKISQFPTHTKKLFTVHNGEFLLVSDNNRLYGSLLKCQTWYERVHTKS